MAALSIRGLDTDQLVQRKSEASRLGISLNRLVLQRLTGDSPQPGRPQGDLDGLAGSWSVEEAEACIAAIAHRPLTSPMPIPSNDLWIARRPPS
jgi:hypothetical protein